MHLLSEVMMNPHFKKIEQAEEVGYYFMHDVIANIKAMSVLFHQYELLNSMEEHELRLLQELNHAVVKYERSELDEKS